MMINHLSGEHFVAVGAGDALDPAVLGLPHVDVADVRAEVGLSAEYPHAEVTPLVDWAPRRAPTLGHWTQLPSQGRGHTLLLLGILVFNNIYLCILVVTNMVRQQICILSVLSLPP